MGNLRFWKRIKFAPGLSLNLSKSGISLSLGVPGAHYTTGLKHTRTTIGIPGSGLFYTSSESRNNQKNYSVAEIDISSSNSPKGRCEPLGFFDRLFISSEKLALIDACLELGKGNINEALNFSLKARHLADGAFLSGILEFNQRNYTNAQKYLQESLAMLLELGTTFKKYDLVLDIYLPICEGIDILIQPSLRGTLLALIETFQAQKKFKDGIDMLDRLCLLHTNDPVVQLSLCEMLMEIDNNQGTEEILHRVLQQTAHIKNESPIHSALLLYRARALKLSGRRNDALISIKAALYDSSDYPTLLINSLKSEYNRIEK